jgi:hypothetical protein
MLAPCLQIAEPWAWRVIPRGLTSGAARLSGQTPTPHHHHNESEAIVYSPMQRIACSTYDLRQKSHQGNTRLSPCSTSGLALKAALLGIVPRQVLPTAHTITRTHNSQKSQLFNPLLHLFFLSSFSSLFIIHHHLHSPSSSSSITSNITIKHHHLALSHTPPHLHHTPSHLPEPCSRSCLTPLPSLLLSTPVIPSTVGSGKNSLEHYRPKVGGPSHSLFSPTHTCSLSSPLTPTASSVIGSACKISPQPRQGKDCLVQKFRNSSVMLEAEHYRPKVGVF